MLNKFVRGSALTDGRPQVFRRYKTFMPENRIPPPPGNDTGQVHLSSKEIAKEQLSRLQEISVEKGNSIEITQSIPGPSSCTSNQIELNKRKRELFTKSAKGKAAKRKMTTKASGPKRKTTSKGKVPLKTQDTPTQSPMEDHEDKEPEEEDLVLLDLGEATGLMEEDGNFIALDNSTISLDSNAIIDIAENWENGNIPNIEDLEDMVDMNSNNESSKTRKSDYHLNDFVVVCFEVINKKEMTTKNYIGQIVEIINQDLVVQFTKDSGTKDYKVWPEIPDISVVSRNQIVRHLEQPDTVIMGRNFYMKFDW